MCTREAKNEEIDEIKKLLKYDVRFILMGFERTINYLYDLQVPDAVKCRLMTLEVINQRLSKRQSKGFKCPPGDVESLAARVLRGDLL